MADLAHLRVIGYNGNNGGIVTRFELVLALVALSALCMPVVGQTTAADWYNKGCALSEQDKQEEAIQAFDKALELNPQYVEAWTKKGVALLRSDRAEAADEAVRCFDNAIMINPNYAEAWYQKGLWLDTLTTSAYIYEGKASGDDMAQEALHCFDEVTRIEPNNTKALDKKGKNLKNLGMFTDALLCYDRIIGIDPEDNWTVYSAWEDKASIYGELKNYELAVKCYDQAIGAYNDDKTSVLYYNLFVDKAIALLELGRTAEAEAAQAKAREFGWTGKLERI
jgi:tetratricopeptide (TPR) repeat protein